MKNRQTKKKLTKINLNMTIKMKPKNYKRCYQKRKKLQKQQILAVEIQ